MMDDHISRQAAIARAVPLNLFGRKVMIVSVSELENLPSAQPEIIRCKDCKRWMREYLDINGKHGCNVMREYTAPNDYCYKAERKE